MKKTNLSEENTRILVAVDGSEESLELVRYVSEAAQPAHSEIVLFMVVSKVPDILWDRGNDSLWLSKAKEAYEWEKKQLDCALQFMTNGVNLLKQAGFHPTAVTTKISPQQEGVSRDIVAESKRRYDVLAIGRGKAGSMQDEVLGGVASKIIDTVTAPALWLVGTRPRSEKILIAMDSSENCLQAVAHAGSVLNRNKNTITLFHAIRGIKISSSCFVDIFPDSYQKLLLDDAEREILPVMLKAEELLNEMDISPERIETKVVSGVRSRAAAVIEEARTNGYGTIIVGRRGISEVADFSMGRVTKKLIQMAKEQTLCIVG